MPHGICIRAVCSNGMKRVWVGDVVRASGGKTGGDRRTMVASIFREVYNGMGGNNLGSEHGGQHWRQKSSSGEAYGVTSRQ